MGAEITQSAASPKPIEAWATAHESRKPGAHCTAFGLLSSQESVLSRQLSWSECFSGSLASLCFFFLRQFRLSWLFPVSSAGPSLS